MQFERELATYKDHLPELVRDEGQYVLIQGDRVVDIFATCGQALRQGYRQFGLEPFLVKQITSTERIHFRTSPIRTDRGAGAPAF